MRDFETQYLDMTPEALEAHVDTLGTTLRWTPEQGRTAEEIEQLLDLLYGLGATGDHQGAAEGFRALRAIIDDFREREGDTPQAMEFFFEWAMLAVKSSPELRNEFVCLPIYEELFDRIDQGPEETKYRGVLARGQFLRHLEFWLAKHGSFDALQEEDRELVKEIRDSYASLHEAAVDACIEREDYVNVVRLFRNGMQVYLLLKRPNDAIRCLKEAIEYLPDTPDFHETQQAELMVHLGQIFVGYGKLDVAYKYFEQAKEIYEEAGEDYEMLAYQAEGWMEDVRKRKEKK